jgi:hypothetical protein
MNPDPKVFVAFETPTQAPCALTVKADWARLLSPKGMCIPPSAETTLQGRFANSALVWREVKHTVSFGQFMWIFAAKFSHVPRFPDVSPNSS